MPWKPSPHHEGDAIRIRASIPDPRQVDGGAIQEEVSKRRRVRITPQMIKKYGFTERCHGCIAINRGASSQSHSEACRRRIEEQLRNEGHEGLKKAEERINEQLADMMQEQDHKRKTE